jgi:hypothetical protein
MLSCKSVAFLVEAVRQEEILDGSCLLLWPKQPRVSQLFRVSGVERHIVLLHVGQWNWELCAERETVFYGHLPSSKDNFLGY